MTEANALHLHELHSKNWGNTAPSPVHFSAQGGLQLVLGPNEAGKTTLMRAIRGFVRGLLAEDPAPRALQDAAVKGRVSLGQTEQWLQRTGRDGAGGPLRDANGTVVPPELGWPAPGRVVYDSLFCLDHETLREGGRQLGRSDTGELGSLLFATLADAGRLTQVKKKSDRLLSSLFNPAGNARNQTVNAAIRGINAAEKALREARVTHQEHGRRKQALAHATASLEQAERAWSATDASMQSLARLVDQLPSLVQLRANEAQQARVQAEGPTPDRAWATEALSAQQALQACQAVQRTREDALAEQVANLAEVVVEETLLSRDADIRSALALLDAYTESCSALPQAQLVLDAALPAWEAALRALGWEPTRTGGPAALPTPADLAELRSAHADLMPRLAAETEARAAAARATAALGAATADWSPDTPPPQTSTSLVEALTAARQDQASAPGRAARANALDREAGSLLRAARAHQLVCDTPEALEAMALPSAARRQALSTALHAADHAVQAARARSIQLREDREALELDLQDPRTQTEAPTAAQLHSLREARDAALQDAFSDPSAHHAGAWKAVIAADHAADQRYQEAEGLGALEARQAQLDRITVQEREASEALAQAAEDRSELDAAWTAEATTLGLPSVRLAELPAWLDAIQDLKRQEATLRAARDALASEEAQAETRLMQLRAVLATLAEAPLTAQPAPATPVLLLDAAEALRDQLAADVAADQERRAAWLAASNTVQEASASQRAAEAACRAPLERWRTAKAPFDPADSITPASGAVWLDQLAAACKADGDLSAARQRVATLQEHIDRFETAAEALADLADPHLPAGARVAWLGERLAEETEQAKIRSTTIKVRDQAQQRLAEADRATTAAQAKLDALVERAGLENPDAVDAARDRAGRLGALEAQARILEQALGGASPDDVEAAVAGRSPEALAADRDAAAQDRTARDAERTAEREAVRAAQAAFEAIDGTAAAAEAAQARADHQSAAESAVEQLLLERACAYLTAQLQDELARQAQTGPVDRAGEVFSTLTLGAFQGLQVEQRDEGGAPLRYVSGLRSNGERVAPQQMSDGTRDALWLSLRVAAIEDLLDQGHRVPVVLDDVAVHLDDDRTRAMLQVFGELAQKTQVLLFTHHRAVVEAAAAAGVPHETLELAPRSPNAPPMNLNPPDPGPRPETAPSAAAASSSQMTRSKKQAAAPEVDLTAILAHLRDHPGGCGKGALVAAGLVTEADWSRVRVALEESPQVRTEGQKRGKRYLFGG